MRPTENCGIMRAVWEACGKRARPKTGQMQTAISNIEDRPNSGGGPAADSARLREIEREIWRDVVQWPPGNPGNAVRSGVRRLAALRLVAERTRRSVLAGASDVRKLDMAERAVSRALRDLREVVADKRPAARGKGAERVPSLGLLLERARNGR